MKKGTSCRLAVLLFGMLAATATIGGEAEAKKPSSATAAKAKKAVRQPFHGKLTAVDKSAMTFTVEEKGKTSTIHITSRTRLSKSGQPATFGDATVGEAVDGQAIKNAAGEEEAATVRIGSKSKSEAKPSTKQPKKPAAEKN